MESLIPIGRIGSPEELKGTAVFLASSALDYLIRSVIVVDGGYLSE
jgi:2-deoxy-D-gluconate 3-dehydrogenase